MGSASLKRLAGIAGIALSATLAASVLAPALSSGRSAVLPSAVLGLLSLLSSILPVGITYALWRITPRGPVARRFAAAFWCYVTSLVLLLVLVLGGWAWSYSGATSSPRTYAALLILTIGVPNIVALAAALVLSVGLLVSSLAPRWVAWLGIVYVCMLAALVLPTWYSNYNMIVGSGVSTDAYGVWIARLGYVARTVGVLFWATSGLSLWRSPDGPLEVAGGLSST